MDGLPPFFADITPTMRYRRRDLITIKAANKERPSKGRTP
jgi:hypothetical protein